MADLRELGYFVAVYEAGNLTAAARRCFVSQPSVSSAIASLEHELETTLFVRHRKGARPTASAELLYPTARRLVDETRALRALFRTPERARPLTIGLMRALDIARVLELIGALTLEPNVHLRLVGVDDKCDARLISRPLLARGEAFVPLWEERFVVALPATHPLALKRTLRVADLAGARVVARCHCEYAERYARQLDKLEIVATAESEEWALALVEAGLGIALVPEGTVRGHAHVVTRTIEGVTVARQVGLAHSARTAPAPEIAALIARATAATKERAGPKRRGGRAVRSRATSGTPPPSARLAAR
jgi:DNA-binding transcriptional LysR family regulator